LKIPEREPEAVNQSRTDDAMTRRTEGQTMAYKTLHRKLRFERQEPH
jgi:hypothetical protein